MSFSSVFVSKTDDPLQNYGEAEQSTLSLVADESPLFRMPRKRLLEHGGCRYCGLPPNFKRPKVDANYQFPKHWGVLAQQAARSSDDVAVTRNLMVGEEGAVHVPVKSPLSKVNWKRLLDHGGCRFGGSPPNFKGPKVDAVPQFRRHGGVLARRTARPSEGVAATGNLKVGEEWAVDVPAKSSGISVQRHLEFESTKSIMSPGSVEVLENKPKRDCCEEVLQKTFCMPKLTNEVLEKKTKMDYCEEVLQKTLDKPKLTNVLEKPNLGETVSTLDVFKFLSQPHLRVQKYPPPKIRKGVSAIRDFPPGVGMQNFAPKSRVLASKSSLEDRPLVETARTDGEKFGGQIEDGHAFKKPEGCALKEKVDGVQAEYTHLIGCEMSKRTSGGISSEYKLKQETDRMDAGAFIEDHSLVRRIGNEVEEYFEDKVAVKVDGVRAEDAHFIGCETFKQARGGTSSKYKVKQQTDRTETSASVGDNSLVGRMGKEAEEYFEDKVAVKVDGVRAEYTHLIGCETFKQTSGVTSSDYKVKQEMDRTEASAFIEDNNLVGRMGKEAEEYFEGKVALNGSGMMMNSYGTQYFDVKPSCGGRVIANWEGERIPNCEHAVARSNETEKANSVLSRKVDTAEVSKQNYTKEKCHTLRTEASSQFGGPLFGDKRQHKYLVPFENIQAVSRNEVRDALNFFEELCTKLSKEYEAQSKGKGRAFKNVLVEAAMFLKSQHKWVNTEKVLGPVPGVEVGDQFLFRAELLVAGLHHQFQGGIDYMKKDGKIFATSIVASGRYANEIKSSDVLIYSGQGGNPKIADKKPRDQKLERGNLALKNSMDAGTPVRVIRGCQTLKASNILGTTSERTLAYVYDGLYMVSNLKQERGQHGKLVFMFQLNRIPGQPKLSLEIVKASKHSNIGKAHGVGQDISQGKEKKPICIVNNVDDERPPLYNYITNMVYPSWYNRSTSIACDCTNGCSDSEECPCTIKNGGEIPFNSNGAIVKPMPLVHECGPSCKCPPSCKNRVSQLGTRYQLEVFKTKSKGWGVRSRNYISSGSFVCEYVGELLRDKEAEQRIGNDEYVFDIGKDEDGNIPQHEALDDDEGFTIDAAYYGNVGRFINHSCSPNLYAQDVLYDHDNKRAPHIMFFAAKNIPPLRELTYDYNYALDQVLDGNGNVKKKKCYCGSRDCRGRMY